MVPVLFVACILGIVQSQYTGSTFTATTSYAYYKKTIVCDAYTDCIVNCQYDNGCAYTDITGPTNAVLTINCHGTDYVCWHMNVDAKNSYKLYIYAMGPWYCCTFSASTIYAPISSNSNNKWFNTFIYGQQGTSYGNTIYAKNGFDDVFYEYFKITNGLPDSSIMYCGSAYQYSCYWTSDTWSDPIWNCDDLTNQCANTVYDIYSSIYQNPMLPVPTQEPTPSPTNLPSDPTKNPTMKPTNYPTSPTRRPTMRPTPVPTPHPTKRPTPAPTRRPTWYPTNKPTEYEYRDVSSTVMERANDSNTGGLDFEVEIVMICVGIVVVLIILGFVLWYKGCCSKGLSKIGAGDVTTEFTAMSQKQDQAIVESDPVIMDLDDKKKVYPKNDEIVTILATDDGNFEYMPTEPSVPIDEEEK